MLRCCLAPTQSRLSPATEPSSAQTPSHALSLSLSFLLHTLPLSLSSSDAHTHSLTSLLAHSLSLSLFLSRHSVDVWTHTHTHTLHFGTAPVYSRAAILSQAVVCLQLERAHPFCSPAWAPKLNTSRVG